MCSDKAALFWITVTVYLTCLQELLKELQYKIYFVHKMFLVSAMKIKVLAIQIWLINLEITTRRECDKLLQKFMSVLTGVVSNSMLVFPASS